ncbi:MAG TPA: PAS domain S-box protein [Puia sp.]|nr:PAS domain S-box protein [Puia sp.]
MIKEERSLFDVASIMEALPGLAVVVKAADQDFHVYAANTAWLKATGLTIGKMRRLPFTDLFAGSGMHLESDAVAHLREIMRESIRTASRVRLPDQRLRDLSRGVPAKTLCWDFDIIPLADEAGSVAHLMISILDKTETIQLEDHYHQLLQMSPDAIVIVGQKGKILEINESAKQMFNYSREELVGKDIEKLIPARFRPNHKAHHAAYFVQPKVRPMGSGLELHAARKGGGEFPVEISLNPLLSGKNHEIAAIIRDITDKKQNEYRLRSSERKYRLLFNENPYPMFIYEPAAFRILEVNDAASTKYEYSRDEFMNMKIQDIFTGVPETEPNGVSHDTRERGAAARKTWKTKKKDGSILTVEVRTFFVDFFGKLARQVLVNDITETIRLQEELALQQKLKQKQITEAMFLAQEEEREHIGRELHDNINQLLATARLFLMTERETPQTSVEMVRKGVKFIDKAIREIRYLSKGLVIKEIVEAGLVNSIKDLIDTINLTKRLQIELQVTELVETDIKEEQKVAIYRIIQEQLSNIIRHSKASHVHISLRKTGSELSLRIDDDGKGFNIQTAKRGIGITNIINRAKLLDGDVKIDTGPDKGCLLEVQLNTKAIGNIY